MTLAIFFIIFCALAAAYPLVIYPGLVMILARLRPQPHRDGEVLDAVVHVITVHNEERRIRAKIENALSVAAPAGGLRTVVADDGSSDLTRQIVESFAKRGVECIPCPRSGKEAAQIEAIRRTDEPLVVFSDVSSMVEPDAIRKLVTPFADPSVGAVSGTDRVRHGTSATGEDLYVRYEMALRRAESRAGSVVGLSGCFFAVRREVARGLLADVPSDMGAALLAIGFGKRAVAQDSAVCTYTTTSRVEREFARKRRTALRGLRCLLAYRHVLRSGAVLPVWQVVSHKWMRFGMPLFALGALAGLSGLALAGHVPAAAALAVIGAAAGLGLAAVYIPLLARISLLRAFGFALLSGSAVLMAWVDLLRGQAGSTWIPTARPELDR